MLRRPGVACALAIALVNTACGSDPIGIAHVYDVVYALEIVGVESEVTSVTWNAADGTPTLVPSPPADWTQPVLAFTGQLVGASLQGSVRNGSIKLTMSALSEGSGGVSGTDSCSDSAGILQTCSLSIPSQILP